MLVIVMIIIVIIIIITKEIYFSYENLFSIKYPRHNSFIRI